MNFVRIVKTETYQGHEILFTLFGMYLVNIGTKSIYTNDIEKARGFIVKVAS